MKNANRPTAVFSEMVAVLVAGKGHKNEINGTLGKSEAFHVILKWNVPLYLFIVQKIS